ncbi:MAG: hypothetical protein ABIV26_07630, partial [Candidatus Limnocylindrales bacterium]
MARRPALPATVAARLILDDVPDAIAGLIVGIAEGGGSIRNLSTVRRLPAPGSVPKPGSLEESSSSAAAGGAHAMASGGGSVPASAGSEPEVGRVELEIEVEGMEEERLVRTIYATP